MKIVKCGIKLDINYENGMILRADALNKQAQEVENRWKYLFAETSDGIVTGCSFRKNQDNSHCFSEGLVKIYGEIYAIDSISEDMIYNTGDINGEETEDDRIYYLCICTSDTSAESKEKSPITEKTVYLKALKETEKDSDGKVIMASFQKAAGRIYFSETLEDHMSRKFSTFCGEYVSDGVEAVSPDYSKLIQKKLEEKNDKDNLDLILYTESLRSDKLSKPLVLFYCSSKLGKPVIWNEVRETIEKAIDVTLKVSVIANPPPNPPSPQGNGFDYTL